MLPNNQLFHFGILNCIVSVSWKKNGTKNESEWQWRPFDHGIELLHMVLQASGLAVDLGTKLWFFSFPDLRRYAFWGFAHICIHKYSNIYIYIHTCIMYHVCIYIYIYCIYMYVRTYVPTYIHTLHYIPRHYIPYYSIPFHTITYHTILYHYCTYHSIPYYTIPFHSIPYTTHTHIRWSSWIFPTIFYQL